MCDNLCFPVTLALICCALIGKTSRPDSICADALAVLLQDHTWFPEEKLEFAEAVDIPTIRHYTVHMLEHLTRVTFYCHGDTLQEKASQLYSNLVSSVIPNYDETSNTSARREDQVKLQRARLLPQGPGVAFMLPALNPRDANSALISHFQVIIASIITHDRCI